MQKVSIHVPDWLAPSARGLSSIVWRISAPIRCKQGRHSWKPEGGRSCPKGVVNCSQTVYVCEDCGEFDYGEDGGPAWEECFGECMEKVNGH